MKSADDHEFSNILIIMTRIWKVSSLSKNANVLMVIVILIIGVTNILWAERLTLNNGFGWDGNFYGTWAKDFYNSIFVYGVPEYYTQRILPSAIVHYGMRLFGVPIDNQSVILAFGIYNLTLLLLSTYVWGLIADELKIGSKGKWLGFCFLFLNCAILKLNFYLPILTDTSAFALGVLMFYFFLTNKPVGLFIVLLAAGFTWPTLPYMAALLYVFPYRKEALPALTPLATPPGFKLHIIFAAGVSGMALLAILYLTIGRNLKEITSLSRNLRIDIPLLYLSIFTVVLYLFFSLKTAWADKRLFDFRYLIGTIEWKRVVLSAVVIMLLKLITHLFSSGEELGWGSMRAFFSYTIRSSLTEPLIFLVAHVVYYGPAILLLLIFWKLFCQSLQEFGVGLRLFVILNIILSINPQSRYQINAVPVFIILLVKMLDRFVLKNWHLALMAVLALFYSKVWYPFNTAPQVDDNTMEILLRFPLQHLFMNSGPWMSHEMYLVQGGVVLLTGLLLYFLFCKARFSMKGRELQCDANSASRKALS